MGPNGAGKSTLLKCLSLIVKPDKGKILLDNQDLRTITKRNIAKRIGYIPQTNNMKLPLKVFDLVMMGRRPYQKWLTGRDDHDKVWNILKLIHLEHLASHYVTELSGGEQQKVNIACALAQEPEILLMDEPTNNLDINHQLEIMNIINHLICKNELTVLTAIHDLNIASRFSNTVLMIKNGKILRCGSSADVITVNNIKALYNVEADVISYKGSPCVIPSI